MGEGPARHDPVSERKGDTNRSIWTQQSFLRPWVFCCVCWCTCSDHLRVSGRIGSHRENIDIRKLRSKVLLSRYLFKTAISAHYVLEYNV